MDRWRRWRGESKVVITRRESTRCLRDIRSVWTRDDDGGVVVTFFFPNKEVRTKNVVDVEEEVEDNKELEASNDWVLSPVFSLVSA